MPNSTWCTDTFTKWFPQQVLFLIHCFSLWNDDLEVKRIRVEWLKTINNFGIESVNLHIDEFFNDDETKIDYSTIEKLYNDQPENCFNHHIEKSYQCMHCLTIAMLSDRLLSSLLNTMALRGKIKCNIFKKKHIIC